MTSYAVSVVATVLNEYGSLPRWLQALSAQAELPTELIVVDGGSTDGTVEFLASANLPFATSLIVAPGCNISRGRNIGISEAAGDVIVVTDAGTRADPDWLERLVRPLTRDESVDVVAGFFAPDVSSGWTEALAAATLPDAGEIDPEVFLPSSRSVAFRRRWFEHGFRYPEWLDYCEDIVFDLQLRRAGARQATALEAIVKFEPRSSPLGFFRQYFRYARGDGKAGLFPQRHVVRYLTYLAGGVIVMRRRPVELGLAAVAGSAYVWKAVRRLRNRRKAEPAQLPLTLAVSLAAVQIVIGDVAKMAGCPAGLWWRYRRDRSIRFWRSGWQSRLPSGRLPRP